MKVKYIDKHYLYLRDEGRCRFCQKAIRYDKMSLDHYYPRSAGGTDDVFNLVTSCKRCNCQKQNKLPEDVEVVHIRQFLDAVKSRKILPSSAVGITPDQLEGLVLGTFKSYALGEGTVFESRTHRFFVVDNKVRQVTVLTRHLEDE